MTTLADLEHHCLAHTVLTYSGARYTVAAVSACTRVGCPEGPTCVGVVDLRHTDNPAWVIGNVHVGHTDRLPV